MVVARELRRPMDTYCWSLNATDENFPLEKFNMSKIIAAAAIGMTLCFAGQAVAAESQACQASWSKMDTKNNGYVMSSDAADHMAAMKAANLKTAAEDRMTSAEYMDACVKDVFKNQK